jgi:hypothetical protein
MERPAPPTAEQVARTIAATVTPISDGTCFRTLTAAAGVPCPPDTPAYRSPGRRNVDAIF